MLHWQKLSDLVEPVIKRLRQSKESRADQKIDLDTKPDLRPKSDR